MKKILVTAFVATLAFAACNSNSDKTKEATKTTETDTVSKKENTEPIAEQLYSCPMHPEVIGKKDSTCSKCGMKLTVPVKN